MVRWRRSVAALFLVITAGAPDTQAQTTTATVRGKTADEQRAVLPGVTITARQVDTNSSRSVVSGELGEYLLSEPTSGPLRGLGRAAGIPNRAPD